MYCASADKECGYLSLLDRVSERMVLVRGVNDVPMTSDVAGKVEDEVQGLKVRAETQCSPDFCVVLGQTTMTGLISYAARAVENENVENNTKGARKKHGR